MKDCDNDANPLCERGIITAFSPADFDVISTPSLHENHQLSRQDLQRGVWSPATLRAYRADWSNWQVWTIANDRPLFPAAAVDVADHLAELSRTRKFATVARRLAAIAHHHHQAGEPFDTRTDVLRATLRGIARTIGTRKRGKDAVALDDIKALLAVMPTTLRGTRDRALILLGFAGAFRRSELVALDVAHLDFARDGVIVLLAKSKTDQAGEGRLVGIGYGKKPATCPVRALKAWLAAAGVTEGPVFRTVNAGVVSQGRYYEEGVALAVKRYARRAGLDPARLAGHSLRSGHVTQASENGAQDRDIMNQTGHKRVETMVGYIRRGTLFKNNSSAALGL